MPVRSRRSPGGSLREYRGKRDFGRTPEPAGEDHSTAGGQPRFVVQKHDATQLHFDLRLEMGGVMRSWAVPKGPSLDPADRRLAMEVEDHPIEYNSFEGTIPEGEYGGGTVMIWDRGTFMPDETRPREKPDTAVRRGYRDGKLSITFHGERLAGSFALVRTDQVEGGPRSKWLLIKHRDEFARPGSKIATSAKRSVVSGRTMKEIAEGKGGTRVWHSAKAGARSKGKHPSRGGGPGSSSADSAGRGSSSPRGRGSLSEMSRLAKKLTPMLAMAGKPAPDGDDWVFEPKYDGVRVLAFATGDEVAIITRNGHDKIRQFPEIAAALGDLAATAGTAFVIDGEIVALVKGRIARFEDLQGRVHGEDTDLVARKAEEAPAALVAFDCLLRGKRAFLAESWTVRRKELEALLEGRTNDTIRISETSDDRVALRRRGEREGWEGIIAKRRSATYRPGERTSDWRKLKIENRQEFVVGGWTEPRRSRKYFGSLLLGYYEDGALIHAGHTGTGFSRAALADIGDRLKKLERKTSPFRDPPETNEKAHWVRPELVVEVKFNEWTREGKLRQSAFLGIRDDKEPKDVVREPAANGSRPATSRREMNSSDAPEQKASGRKRSTERKDASGSKPGSRTGGGQPGRKTKDTSAAARSAGRAKADAGNPTVAALLELRAGPNEGEIPVGRGKSLHVSSLDKVFYPRTGHTKGDLLVYYARMADHILPWMKDRPLVLRRFPDGVDGESFYQQSAPDKVPDGVRVETIHPDGESQRRFVGGNLGTLLHTIQLGAISWDPWHSRVGALRSADYSILDLDPGPGVTFRRVVEVALRVRDELDELGLHGAVKTSGSEGIHIYLPLPPRTPLDAATLVARIVATRVAEKHPKVATVERMTRKRPRGTVYVDFLQNLLSKSVAGVYAARARPEPTVSTPLRWDELTPGLDRREFTIDTVPDRINDVGDLWKEGMSKLNDLSTVRASHGSRVAAAD